jgi:hypothetical protein
MGIAKWKQFVLTVICMIIWLFFLLSLAGAAISRAIPSAIPLYSNSLELLITGFWWSTMAFLGLAIIFYDTYIVKIKQQAVLNPNKKEHLGESTALTKKKINKSYQIFSGILIVLMLFPAFVIISESYILLHTSTLMRILVVVLSLLAVISKVLSRTAPENRFIKVQFTFVIALGIILAIFQNLLLTPPFKKAYLKSARDIDRILFINTAAKLGKNITESQKNEFKETFKTNNTKKAQNQTFQESFKIYTQRLKKNILDSDMYPDQPTSTGESYHASLTLKSLRAINNTQDPKEKRSILKTWLNYLTIAVKKDMTVKLKNVSSQKLGIPYLQRLIRVINTNGLSLDTGIRKAVKQFYCALLNHTTINPYPLKNFLGKEEISCRN